MQYFPALSDFVLLCQLPAGRAADGCNFAQFAHPYLAEGFVELLLVSQLRWTEGPGPPSGEDELHNGTVRILKQDKLKP